MLTSWINSLIRSVRGLGSARKPKQLPPGEYTCEIDKVTFHEDAHGLPRAHYTFKNIKPVNKKRTHAAMYGDGCVPNAKGM